MTNRERELLELIDQGNRRSGVCPSFDECKDAMGLKSKSGIHRLVRQLEDCGFITRFKRKNRAIYVTSLGMRALQGKPLERVG